MVEGRNLEIKQSCSISEVVEGWGRQSRSETSKLSGRAQFWRWWKVVGARGGWKPRNRAVVLNFGGGGRWGKAEEVRNLEIEQLHSILEVVDRELHG